MITIFYLEEGRSGNFGMDHERGGRSRKLSASEKLSVPEHQSRKNKQTVGATPVVTPVVPETRDPRARSRSPGRQRMVPEMGNPISPTERLGNSIHACILIRILIYFSFQPLEVVSRYRDPQPQVVENY